MCGRCGGRMADPDLSFGGDKEVGAICRCQAGYPDDNPKTAVGASKVPLHLVPPAASHYTALAFKDGATKYGPYNWREHTVSASVYYGAARRHLDAWWDGEDVSRDALVHHLGHVMACCAILLDAMSIGKLNDDRPTPGAAPDLQAEFAQQAPQPGTLDALLIERRGMSLGDDAE